MYEIIILLFILLNIYIVIKYVKKKHGCFQAPFIISIVSLVVFTPQYTTILYNDYYKDKTILYLLGYTMLTCNFALWKGFEIGNNIRTPKYIYDLKFQKSEFLFLILAIIGLVGQIRIQGVFQNTIEDPSEQTSYLIFYNLSTLIGFAFIYSITYAVKLKKFSKIVLLIIVITSLMYIELIFLLARRNLTLRITFLLFFLISIYKPFLEKYAKIIILSIFCIGFFLNPSIANYRENLKVGQAGYMNVHFFENFKNSFTSSISELGMDLGNAALGIDYVYKNNYYDYGAFMWNDFIQLYVPRFIVGESKKKSLQIRDPAHDYMKTLERTATTSTGYFDAFRSFSFLGFLLFGVIGLFLGILWKYAHFSGLFLLLYLFLLEEFSSIITHKTSYLFGRIEFLLIFILPIIAYYISRKRILQ